MDENIRNSIAIRSDFFTQYYTVPEDVKPDVDAFLSSLEVLGNECTDVADFEAKFASKGYQETFNSLLPRCTPKPYQMTAEEKAHSKEVAKEMFKEDRSRILKEAAEEALDHVAVAAESEAISMRREAMIEAGVMDEYTRATNAAENISAAGSFFGKLFKKKK